MNASSSMTKWCRLIGVMAFMLYWLLRLALFLLAMPYVV
jgi:hypothetical protein